MNVFPLELPPLRERPLDIIPLARSFLARLGARVGRHGMSLAAAAERQLEQYAWPGNIRELENVIERAAVLSVDGLIMAEHLPQSIVHGAEKGSAAPGDPLKRTLAEVERDHIREVLQRLGGNRTRAAKALGISATTLWRKLKV